MATFVVIKAGAANSGVEVSRARAALVRGSAEEMDQVASRVRSGLGPKQRSVV